MPPSSLRLKDRLQDWAVALVVALYGYTDCLRTARFGFDIGPDVFYYSGYAASQGAMPFIGLFTSYGAPMFLIHGAVAALFGPSWDVYLFHAAAWNALFAAMTYFLLRRLGLGPFSGGIYAMGTALLFYGPVGFLQPDKISYPFLLAALLLQLACFENRSRRFVILAYAAVAVLALTALLCKLNPVALFPLALAVPFLLLGRAHQKAALQGTALALAGVVLAAGLIEALHPGFVRSLTYYAFQLPLSVGADRMKAGLSLTKLGSYASYATLTLVLAGAVGALACLAPLAGKRPNETARGKMLLPALLGLALWAIMLFHVTHIAQPMPTQLTLALVALGCFHAAMANRLVWEGGANARLSLRILAALLLSFVVVDLTEFHRRNVKFRSMIFDASPVTGQAWPKGSIGVPDLAQVSFVPAERFPPGYADDIRKTYEALAGIDGNVFLFGLQAQYYVFTRKAPVAPVWSFGFSGHTTPPAGSEQERRLAGLLLDNLLKHKVERVAAPLNNPLRLGLPVCDWQAAGPIAIGRLCRELTKDDVDVALALMHAE